MPVARPARQRRYAEGHRAWRERTETKLWNSRSEDRDGRRLHCRCEMQRGGIVRDEHAGARNQFGGREQGESSSRVDDARAGRALDRDSELPIRLGSDDDDPAVDRLGQRCVVRPALCRPDASRCERDQRLAVPAVLAEQRVDPLAFGVARKEPRAR